MNNNVHSVIALDVGTKRIGIAHADTAVRFPVPYGTLEVDGLEIERLREIIAELEPSLIIVGYPRNQQGEPTAQTGVVKEFAQKLEPFQIDILFQDESLTSVLAEKYLQSQNKPYTKSDIDAHAAAIILGDYLEEAYGQ
ncbi:Holliday junction resolvase YqgF [candidate division TM7 genomosp. GTL1]|nr:Holliday junction resolvase YqgF [candidate division TM7 genomosp. GTL1]